MREINKTNDIDGCGPDTVVRGPSTKRCLNPLNPTYQIPGQAEKGNNIIDDPYGAAASSMSKTNYDKARANGVNSLKIIENDQ